jgi:hypothetical protein
MQPETGNQIPSQCSAARYNLSSDGMLSEMKEVSVLSVNVYKTFRRWLPCRTFEFSNVSTEIADSSEHL